MGALETIPEHSAPQSAPMDGVWAHTGRSPWPRAGASRNDAARPKSAEAPEGMAADMRKPIPTRTNVDLIHLFSSNQFEPIDCRDRPTGVSRKEGLAASTGLPRRLLAVGARVSRSRGAGAGR